jgi:hypothetical protein
MCVYEAYRDLEKPNKEMKEDMLTRCVKSEKVEVL